MYVYLLIILAYLLALTVYNFVKARKVKSQDDFMVAGRSLGIGTMVFTLICTWIGSGTFIAGAEYAAKAGWSSLWLPAGAWAGILVIYFLAARIRTFGQYTIGDILEARYGRFARLFGAVSLLIAFVTIVSYQFRAGGYILNVITNGAISVELGQTITAAFVIGFTALGGMVAVAHTDLPNGIIIVLACLVALPFAVVFAGGWEGTVQALPASHFQVFSEDFGEHPALKAGGYFLATMMLLMGVQSMYQKFYSARTPQDARKAVALWIVGTIVVETVVVAIAIFSASAHWGELKQYEVVQAVQKELSQGLYDPGRGDFDPAMGRLELAQVPQAVRVWVERKRTAGQLRAEQAVQVEQAVLAAFDGRTWDDAQAAEVQSGIDPASIVLQAARDITTQGGIPGLVVGLLLLAAACAVVLSTGMNYLLSPSSSLIRDVVQEFMGKKLDEKQAVALQKLSIVLLGLVAFAMIFVPTVLHLEISVLSYSYFAYTMYGVAITPALVAALTWKRATRAGGVASIVSGAFMALLLEIVVPRLFPQVMRGGDPFGIPGIYPALAVSVGTLVLVSLLTPRPGPEVLAKVFGGGDEAQASPQSEG